MHAITGLIELLTLFVPAPSKMTLTPGSGFLELLAGDVLVDSSGHVFVGRGIRKQGNPGLQDRNHLPMSSLFLPSSGSQVRGKHCLRRRCPLADTVIAERTSPMESSMTDSSPRQRRTEEGSSRAARRRSRWWDLGRRGHQSPLLPWGDVRARPT